MLRVYALTLNNIACVYKRQGKHRCALQYLKAALQVEMATDAPDFDLATTLLNTAVLHNTLGQFFKSIRQTLRAIYHAKHSLNNGVTQHQRSTATDCLKPADFSIGAKFEKA